jgi:hypothetical protein
MKTDEIFLFLGQVNFFTFLMCGNSAKIFSHQFCIVVNYLLYKRILLPNFFFHVNNKGMNSCLWIKPVKVWGHFPNSPHITQQHKDIVSP